MFTKIGWFVTNEYEEEELQTNKPAQPILEKVCSDLGSTNLQNMYILFSSNAKFKLKIFESLITRFVGKKMLHQLLKMRMNVKLPSQLANKSPIMKTSTMRKSPTTMKMLI